MKVIIENGKDFKILLNTAQKCTSEMSGGSLAVKCVQLLSIKDETKSDLGKGWLKIIAYKEGLCSLVGVMEDVIVKREGSLFVDKSTITELLDTLSIVESTNALISIERENGKDLEIKVKGYGSKKFGVITKDESGEDIRFPVSGLNSSNKEWKDIFKDSSGKLIDKFIKVSSHIDKQNEVIELRIEQVISGANHYEISINSRLMGACTVRYISHIQMSEENYSNYVGTSFLISTRLKDMLSLFKGGFTFSVCGDKNQIFRLSNTRGDTLTFFPSSITTIPSNQIDAAIKNPDTLFSMDVELNALMTALKFHMGESTGGDVELNIKNDYLYVKGCNSVSPAEIQLHSRESYGKGWSDLIINTFHLISGGQPILNLMTSAGNVIINIVPFMQNNTLSRPDFRVVVIKPYAEFEGGSPTICISGRANDYVEDISVGDNTEVNKEVALVA